MYLAHGATKLLVFTPAGTAQYFASLGVPGFLGYLAIVAELGGAALLLSGYKARWVALLLTPLLLGTIILVHGAHAGNTGRARRLKVLCHHISTPYPGQKPVAVSASQKSATVVTD